MIYLEIDPSIPPITAYLDRPEDPETTDCTTCVRWWPVERRNGRPVRGECRLGREPSYLTTRRDDGCQEHLRKMKLYESVQL